LATMRKQLDDELLKSRDVMLLPEYELGRISKTTTPYEWRLSDTNYPFKSIYAAASLSGKRSKNIAMQQVKLLKDKNNIVRYWAIVGLRSQSAAVLKPYAAIKAAMSDVYEPVAITASAIAWQNYADHNAEANLKKFCNNDNEMLALMTINYLLYVDNKKPFVNTIQTLYKTRQNPYNVKAACQDFLGSEKLVANDAAHEQ